MHNELTRREFIARASAAGLAVGALGAVPHVASASAAAPEPAAEAAATSAPDRRADDPVIAVFSKHLQWLPFADLGPLIADSGFTAVDLTVRPGGHVLPERVEVDLPRAVETLRKSGLTVPLITTAIIAHGDPLTRRVLTTARQVGVTHYRMGYWIFPANTDPLSALREMKPRAAALAALNRQIGIRGGYQNHVGTRVGGSVWDLGILLEGIEPDGLGVQYDIRHAVAEGGESWPVALRMIAPHIDTIALKDLIWAKRPDGRWEPRTVPLGEGMVNFDAYLRQLLARGPLPPATMHFEYPPLEMDGGGDATRRRQTVEGMHRDLTRFKQLLAAASVPAKAAPAGS
jgi:sugar phosphate isomerase/epimerase